MRARQSVTALFLAAAIVVPLASATNVWARSNSAKELRAIDTDNDGTIDLKEAQAAANATFEKLERDKDTTLTTKELQGRISRKEMKAADSDSDGTLDKKEYGALVEQRFKSADPDGDGKLDAKELKSPAGRNLMRLLK